MLDLLMTPGMIVGSIVGVGLSLALRWVFPTADLLFAQALLVATCSVVGLVLDFTGRRKRDR